MKIIINSCFGGFDLSPLALSEYAKLIGKGCYFFDLMPPYKRLSIDKAEDVMIYACYTVKNPEKYQLREKDADGLYKGANERAKSISLFPDDSDVRTDLNMISVVEKFGEKASGKYGKLKVIEIPDGIEYQIDEYDGMESIHEIHRSWE